MNTIAELWLSATVAAALIILLWQLNSHMKAIRSHLRNIAAAQTPDFRSVRELADEVIVLRTALNGNFGAVHKLGLKLVEKLEAIVVQIGRRAE